MFRAAVEINTETTAVYELDKTKGPLVWNFKDRLDFDVNILAAFTFPNTMLRPLGANIKTAWCSYQQYSILIHSLYCHSKMV